MLVDLQGWFDDHESLLIKLIRSLIHPPILDDIDLDDVIQQLRCACWRASFSYDPLRDTPFELYAYPFMLHAIQDIIRAHGKTRTCTVSLDELLPGQDSLTFFNVVPNSASPDPEDLVCARETRDMVEDVLRRHFSPLQRRILHDMMQGYRQVEISTRNNVTQSYVSQIRKRFRIIVQKTLNGEQPKGRGRKTR